MTDPDRITRRHFLGLSTLQLLALAPPVRWLDGEPPPEGEETLFGRVLEATIDVHRQPSFASEKVKTIWRDQLITLRTAVVGDNVPEHNRIWYEAPSLGFLHSSAVQPVYDRPNEPVVEIPEGGQLMETTVPYVDARWKPKADAPVAYRFYFGTTCWVIGSVRDSRARRWYHIRDDKYVYHYFAPAEAFRPVSLAELTPIAPNVPIEEKRIEVTLSRQWLECFEGGEPVFTTRVSTGRLDADGAHATPGGEFLTFRKRGSRHMSAGNRASGYDLVGVPWVAYITVDGISIHGTYWHNDFGIPRSHGCINMTPEAAKWLYRWTLPVVPSDEQQVWEDFGTNVQVRI